MSVQPEPGNVVVVRPQAAQGHGGQEPPPEQEPEQEQG